MRIIQFIKEIFKFFPVQLFLLNFKKNYFLLVIWFILFAIVTQNMGERFGLHYLFLTPEYLNEVGFLSYFILGFSIGGFFMAFHLYNYVIMGPSFPFIATLSRPFFKFSINNSILPLIFYLTLISQIYKIETNEELTAFSDIVIHITALTIGIISFIVISNIYFFNTNKNAIKIKTKKQQMVKSIFLKPSSWIKLKISEKYHPNYYLYSLTKIRHSRDAEHYDEEILNEVFKQNYFNSFLFEVAVIISFVLLGLFSDNVFFIIPAAASVVLLFTLILMLVSVLYSWLKGWYFLFYICLAFLLNYLSAHTNLVTVKSFAYGLNYDTKVEYSLKNIKEIQFNKQDLDLDLKHHIQILENWKQKAVVLQHNEKPKLILVNCSGGGVRSAMWTFNVLQSLDEKMDGAFFPNVHMITGASGGMIGSTFYREIFRRSHSENYKLNDPIYLNSISNDLLNGVTFSLVTSDLFLRNRLFEYKNKVYRKDRGFIFEKELDKNTNNIMSNSLGDYYQPEYESEIPLVYLSPTIINDGRRLVISPQPSAFLNGTTFDKKDIGPENVELIKLFKDNDPLDLKFLTAIRMNSTFPYILPMVSMPTKPEIAIMDAGIRDNYGTKLTIRYINAIKEWIEENTSGIILVEIRDLNKDYELDAKENISIFDRMIKPTTNFYGNFQHSQGFNANELVETSNLFAFNFDIVTFTLRQNTLDKISLSWHLTKSEKDKIKSAFKNEMNQKELNKLINLLK